jgi:hypothetical protein
MFRKLAGCIAVTALLVCAVPAVSADATQHFGPFASTTTDGGTCGNDWANDTVNRDFLVQSNKDGTFTVREEFKNGAFVTIAGASPGACETDKHHGATVNAGVSGSFQGEEEGPVTGGTFNANGCAATGADCTTTAGFIAAVFGPGAQISVATYKFHYAAGAQGLIYHEWDESFSKRDTSEQDKGDIASA